MKNATHPLLAAAAAMILTQASFAASLPAHTEAKADQGEQHAAKGKSKSKAPKKAKKAGAA